MQQINLIVEGSDYIASILTFVVLYSGIASRDSYQRQIEYFENTTAAMEQVTENYSEASRGSAMYGHTIYVPRP